MARIEFTARLKKLLDESNLQAPLRLLADRVSEILADNKLPFFPDYTDHGVDHVNRVLTAEVSLVPPGVWEQSLPDSEPRLLWDVDAAVIIGATLLHDIAMHLRPDGFRELVGKDSRFRPLTWFKEDQEGHQADRPWDELWQDYVREARRFSDRVLANIVGQETVRRGWKFQELPEDAGRWERNHLLVVGEFIRRHHARLAHEIAIYGFPGVPAGSGEAQFPALGTEVGHPLGSLADLIGVAARSHGTSLRVCKAYLESSANYLGTPRPMGCAALFPMALLRVADYLQIDRKRAPAVLLQLRDPQSPVSVQEWQKHLAVRSITPATDPRGLMITVSGDVSLELYLQLRDLVAGIQAEMDHSTAVLDEAYGARSDLGLNQLNLAQRRVYSNLHSPAFRDSLPYVSERTGFSADPNLLMLLVEPLYGKQPSVGVRELMQNAVDAVRELHTWCETHGVSVSTLDLAEQEADVLIEYIKRDDDRWLLRVTDRGIGMRGDTIQDYFLRAGASFRQSAEWTKEYLDQEGKPRVLRAGRFGIGAFAVFLLGPTFRLRTRHAGAASTMGHAIEATGDDGLIAIQRLDGLPVGTTVEVELTADSVRGLGLEHSNQDSEQLYEYFYDELTTTSVNHVCDWFCWEWPKVVQRIVHKETTTAIAQQYVMPNRSNVLPPEWSAIHPRDFDAVYWTFENFLTISCNGIRILPPAARARASGIRWHTDFEWPKYTQTAAPSVAILDGSANLPLTVQRFGLTRRDLSFTAELARDVTFSLIAYALVCGPDSRFAAHPRDSRCPRHPLVDRANPTMVAESHPPEETLSRGKLRWCSSSQAVVPADPWLLSLLGLDTCIAYGLLNYAARENHQAALGPWLKEKNNIILCRLDFNISTDQVRRNPYLTVIKIMNMISLTGVPWLCQSPRGVRAIISESKAAGADLGVLSQSQKTAEDKEGVWRDITPTNSSLRRLERRTGNLQSTPVLEAFLGDFERAEEIVEKTRRRYGGWQVAGPLYACEIMVGAGDVKPGSLIATIWSECLGPQPIPFDPAARAALIEHGRQHPELKRHIEAWQRMKAAGSPYTKGTT